jgi:hypothetical protein
VTDAPVIVDEIVSEPEVSGHEHCVHCEEIAALAASQRELADAVQALAQPKPDIETAEDEIWDALAELAEIEQEETHTSIED